MLSLTIHNEPLHVYTNSHIRNFEPYIFKSPLTGVGGVYKGVTATVMKQGSNQAIRFFVMESLRDWYKGGDRNKPVPKYIVALFGGVAGMYSIEYFFFKLTFL